MCEDAASRLECTSSSSMPRNKYREASSPEAEENGLNVEQPVASSQMEEEKPQHLNADRKLGWKAWTALIVFVFQNAFGVMLVRYTKVYAVKEYSSEVAVLMQELAVKLPLSMFLFSLECAGPVRMVAAVARDVQSYPIEWLCMIVPSAIYTVQMILIYYGLANVRAAIGQVTYQSKIIFTALAAVLLLQKKLKPNQWIALADLLIGVILVQDFSSNPQNRGGRSQAENPILGTIAFLVAAMCSAFANVYLEKMIKGERKPSIWLRNIQLAFFGTVVAGANVIRVYLKHFRLMEEEQSGHAETRLGDNLARDGLFHGIDALVWFSIVWQAGGGLLVALTIKYADNILRCFAQAGAIILVAMTTHFVVGFDISPLFGVGVLFVVSAIFLYGEEVATPRELLEVHFGITSGCFRRITRKSTVAWSHIGGETPRENEGTATSEPALDLESPAIAKLTVSKKCQSTLAGLLVAAFLSAILVTTPATSISSLMRSPSPPPAP